MLSTLRSLWAWFSIGTLILLWVPLMAVVHFFDRDPASYRTGRWFRRLGAMMVHVNPAWKVHITGETIDDPRRPYVVVGNHLSMADIPAISLLPWDMKWVAKAELFKVPLVGWMMRIAGDIPVDRSSKRSRAQVLFTAKDYLDMRCSVMFFPEGTRSVSGRMLEFNDGPFRLAIKAGIPILPLVIDGSQNALPKNTWRFGTADHIHIHVLPVVDVEGLTAADTQELRARVRRQILEQVAAWRGVPPEEADATVGDDGKDSAKTAAEAG
jgi:1-acyl-sn-glycerol-3-phosphate acyltransferase